MSRKDFIALGDMMRITRPMFSEVNPVVTSYNQGRLDMWVQHRDSLAGFFATTYPNFNREVWLRYVEGGTV